MDVRRACFRAAVRLAVVLSTVAAVVAIVLDAVGEVSRSGLVLSVIVVGFALSWLRTGQLMRTNQLDAHRIAVVPLRHPVG